MMPFLERVVLALGVLMRVYLTAVNAEANDDHLSVIRIIADEHRFPRLRDAWEGFQPKLYHASVALLWKLSPLQASPVRVRIAQLVSCAAGVATLYVVRRALLQRGISPQVRLVAFALVALNPTLVGLNVQATNDSFVILFGTLALASGCEFFRTGTRRSFLILTASTALAALAKGNGLVVCGAVVATLVDAIRRSPVIPGLTRGALIRLSSASVVVVVMLVVTFGPYRANWEDTGNPFAINGEQAPVPHLVERTQVYRPGITSIIDGYFTFRFIDMLQHPAITNDATAYALHRTSLWSQLYARAHSAHFAQHPPSWKNTSPLVATVTRVILLLGLLPTLFLLAGLIRSVVRLMHPASRRLLDPREQLIDELLALSAIGFFAFVIIYTLLYRDFSTMKAEFLFPALLTYAVFFGDEAQRAEAGWARRGWLRFALRGALGVLIALYVADVAILAIQLT